MELLFQVEEMVAQWLARDVQQRRMNKAARRAWMRFAAENPEAVRSLFDEHFVLAHVVPMLQEAAQTGAMITPVLVAERWAGQISVLPAMRRRHVQQMLPTAARFLALVADELDRSDSSRQEALTARLSAAF